ncbi:hypothetical protein RHMOL_Rhmol13G0004400 [Rhododendron molle]|uniref:Uncharacterized protein n=1 Tax=Rhododendron molle TaxID=49168 RepID=A0ACC0L1K0_RHOML|nr:hypothetical protein RHMOL_Rhmol13G0004400 [Rhododendron molle]
MDSKLERCHRECIAKKEEEEMTAELRKGAWTFEEDSKLIECISIHGPAQWSYLARTAGLKRTGKSCRLRWLNYLHPDVKHGNFTLEEQILILELHSHWGNRLRERVKEAAVGSAQSSMVQPTNTTPTDLIANCNNTTTGHGLLDSNCTKSETPDQEANQVSPASDLISTYGDHHGDVLLSGSNWWESIEEGSIYTDQVMSTTSAAFSIGYYSELEEGYGCRIFEECNRWLGGGDSSSST